MAGRVTCPARAHRPGSSRLRGVRTGLAKLARMAENGKFDVMVFDVVDRLGSLGRRSGPSGYAGDRHRRRITSTLASLGGAGMKPSLGTVPLVHNAKSMFHR